MYRGKVLLPLPLQKAVLWPKLLKREFKKRLIILQFCKYSNKEQSYSLLSIISLDCPNLVNSAMALEYPHCNYSVKYLKPHYIGGGRGDTGFRCCMVIDRQCLM